MQIRDGLHIFGVSPQGIQLRHDLLVGFRPDYRGERARGRTMQSLHPGDLALDLGLDAFDPLDCAMASSPGQGPRPERSGRDHQ